jgi:hypothetical protein
MEIQEDDSHFLSDILGEADGGGLDDMDIGLTLDTQSHEESTQDTQTHEELQPIMSKKTRISQEEKEFLLERR